MKQPCRPLSTYRSPVKTKLWFTMSAVCLASIVLFGCSLMTGDAPTALVSTGQANGVNIKSSSTPYRVRSLSRLNKVAREQRRWTVAQVEREELEVAEDCLENWCWAVFAVPTVSLSAASSSEAGQSLHCSTPHDDRFCRPLDWTHAFSRLRKLVGYMVEGEPPPTRVRLHLLPEGDGFSADIDSGPTKSIGLEFGRWWPVSQANSSAATIEALADTVSTTAYELQHVIFAAHQWAGMDRNVRAIQDEARSTCWDLSTRLALFAGYQESVEFPRMNDAMFESYQDIFGSKPEYGKASLQGPVMAWRELTQFTAGKDGVEIRAGKVRLNSSNIRLVNDVLGYCKELNRTTQSIWSSDFEIAPGGGDGFFPVNAGESK